MNSSTTLIPPTWVFARGSDHVRIQRVEPRRLVVTPPTEDARHHDFDSIGALLDFQVDYEKQLIASGWRLVEFSPERRSRRDRRSMPRFGEDRRQRPTVPDV